MVKLCKTPNPMSSKSILSILLIEDNPGDVRLINELLIENTSLHHQLHVANSLGEGCNLLKNHEFTVILLDLNLPDSCGKDTFNTVFQNARNIPIILITGLQDVEQVLSYIKEGAQDYVIKADLNSNLLLKTIHFAIERKKLMNELVQKTKTLQQTMNYFTDRELKMIELKKEINELIIKQGGEKKYLRNDSINS